MRNLQIIRDIMHAQFLHTRNINNLVQSDNFEIAYNAASEDERTEILQAIGEGDKDSVKEFIETKLLKGTPFEKMGIKKLREIAKFNKIYNWWSLNKTSLIEEIQNVATRSKEASERKHLQSKETEFGSENYNGCR